MCMAICPDRQRCCRPRVAKSRRRGRTKPSSSKPITTPSRSCRPSPPGAENAAGIVALLQLVELLKEYRPHYSVLFLATSGHFEGLSGINDFLYRHSRRSDYFRERMSEAERIDFDLMLSLDLSSHCRPHGQLWHGHLLQSQVAH